MALLADGRALIRRKMREGKRMVYVDTSTFWQTYTGERSTLRLCTRRNVAFLTPAEYAAWQQRGTRNE